MKVREGGKTPCNHFVLIKALAIIMRAGEKNTTLDSCKGEKNGDEEDSKKSEKDSLKLRKVIPALKPVG